MLRVELQATYAARAAGTVSVVYSNWQSYELHGRWQTVGPIHRPLVDDQPVFRIVKEVSFGYVGPTLIRRTALEQVNGFVQKPNIGEDMDLMLRIAMAGGEFRQVHSEAAAFFYRQSPGSLWRFYIKHGIAMRNLLFTFRDAEEFLRAQSKDGTLPREVRDAFAFRYSRFADFYLEHDPMLFKHLSVWLKALETNPPGLSSKLNLLVRVVGFENAVRLKTFLRNNVGSAA